MSVFGETTVLNDGRRVMTPWKNRGIYVGDVFHDGPELRMPDAALTSTGKVWVCGRHQLDRYASVWLSSVGTWWTIPQATFGTRMILRADGEGCRVAFTTSPTTWVCVSVSPTGVFTVVSGGTVPNGDGGMGMRDWTSAGLPRPLSPLDQSLLGHQVRAAVTAGATTIAASVAPPLPPQSVMARGLEIGTLLLGGVDWTTPRLSPNEKWWVGVRYDGEHIVGGAVPTLVPPLAGSGYRPVAPVGRAAYIGFFNHQKPPANLPGACAITVYDQHFLRRLSDNAIIGRFVAGDPGHEGDLASLNKNIQTSRTAYPGLSVLAYWTRSLWAGALPTGATWLGVEAYQLNYETDAALLSAIDAQAARHPSWYLGQCYTSNALLTSELTHLPSLYSQALKARPSVLGVVAFSGYGRATGYTDHPEAHAPWTDLSHAVTGIPNLPAWTPPKPIDPTPPNPKPPMTITFRASNGQYVCAEEGGNHAVNANRDVAGPWETFGRLPQPDGRFAYQSSGGYYLTAEEGGGGALSCNRTAVGPWECFRELPVNGGIALQSDNGHFVCAEEGGGGIVNVTRTGAGPWETFNAPVAPKPPEPVEPGKVSRLHPDGHVFRDGNNTAWRWKGVSAFQLCDRWVRGEDISGFLAAYQGYNVLRVWSYVEGPNWTDPTWNSPTPEKAVEFVQAMNAAGWWVEWVPLTSSNPARIAQARAEIAAFTAANVTGLFLEGANEPEVQNPDRTFITCEPIRNALEDSGYPYTNGCYTEGGKRHWGTYLTTHTQRDSEWPRRSHDAYDHWVKPADAPAGAQAIHKPCILDEPAKLQDVSGDRVNDWKAYFGSGSMFCAGATFHSKTGKFAQPPTAEEAQLAAAALVGLNAFPPEAPLAFDTYRRIDGDGLRTYVIGNAMTRIRPNKPQCPESGWTEIDAAHILWRR